MQFDFSDTNSPMIFYCQPMYWLRLKKQVLHKSCFFVSDVLGVNMYLLGKSSKMWVKHNPMCTIPINHHHLCGLLTIPSHGWFVALFLPTRVIIVITINHHSSWLINNYKPFFLDRIVYHCLPWLLHELYITIDKPLMTITNH